MTADEWKTIVSYLRKKGRKGEKERKQRTYRNPQKNPSGTGIKNSMES